MAEENQGTQAKQPVEDNNPQTAERKPNQKKT